ncbi:MAG TPA: Ig-like domain repeat protein [Terriglobia bacterium]|nr:Ig-like domain repeat protein [Terriglobia bacterium]
MSARRLTVVVAGSIAGLLLAASPAASQGNSPVSQPDYPVQLTVPPQVGLPSQAHPGGPPRVIPLYHPPFHPRSGNVADPVLQTSTPTPAAAQGLGQWEGLGEGYPGFTVAAVPPDPNMAVGPNHIVQWVNNALVIFDKQGNQLQAPVDDSTFWGAFSTCYQGGGFSDPIVKYDRAADRWVVGEVAIPAFPGLLGQFAQCFAVSKTSDPTFTSDANGNNTSYYLWAYGFGSNVNDYDKIAVWADGYYVTWNIFQNGSTFIGAEACAWNRTQMLSGVASPGFKCFQLSSSFASLLPGDWDGATAPPAGSPDYFMDIDPGSGALNLWKFHADFANLNNSTFTGPTSVAAVAPFTAPCFDSQTGNINQDCLPQPGTTQLLDALGDRLMYRLAYRNLGDHESLVANHTVLTAGGNTGVRWYEVRSPNSTPTLYQQGTFAPDTDNRWMASVAMDKSGNIGVGYSVASGATFPSIRYTGWEVGNPTGTLQAETSLVAGGGSQTGYNRWGDYSVMQIDPSDDCTFWYTQEYQATTQTANWNTRIGSFKFPSCGQALPATTTTLGPSSANPSTYGQSVTFTATVTSGAGTPTGSVTFKDGSTTLGSSALNASGVATLSLSSLTAGGHSITATYGGSASYSGSTSSALNQTVKQAGTTTSLTSSSNPSNGGQAVTFTATVSPVAPASTTPTGTVTFFDGGTSLGTQNLSGGTATLATSSLTVGAHNITATYNGDSNYTGSNSNTVSQTVADFSISATPSSPTISRGSSANYTVTVTALNSFSGTVNFSVSGVPNHSTASFSPTSVSGSGNSTLTVLTTSKTPKGTFTLTIKGTSGTLAHSTTVKLTVK